MTFAEVLPHLAAGKRARRAAWPDGRWTQRKGSAVLSVWMPVGMTWKYATDVDFADLLATDWELTEEPTPRRGYEDCLSTKCKHGRPYDCTPALQGTVDSLRDDITALRVTVERLTRELAATKQAKAENDERFMTERDQARRELAEAKRELPTDRICQGSAWPRLMFCVYDSAGKCAYCGRSFAR